MSLKNKNYKEANKEYPPTKIYYQFKTILDYKNAIMEYMSYIKCVYDMPFIKNKILYEKFKNFCKEQFNNEFSEEAIDTFVSVQFKKDHSN